MPKTRNASGMSPAKSSKPSVPDAIKTELATKANDLIENVLKPKHVLPPKPGWSFNYIIDISTKWNRNYFYFFATYACPGDNALAPTFDSNFARLEFLGDGKFGLAFMRHTGAWVDNYNPSTIDQCLQAIQNDPWFTP